MIFKILTASLEFTVVILLIVIGFWGMFFSKSFPFNSTIILGLVCFNLGIAKFDLLGRNVKEKLENK